MSNKISEKYLICRLHCLPFPLVILHKVVNICSAVLTLVHADNVNILLHANGIVILSDTEEQIVKFIILCHLLQCLNILSHLYYKLYDVVV